MRARSLSLPLVVAVVAVASFASLACSTSPERLCDHMVSMAERQFGDLSEPSLRDKAMQSCVQEKTALRNADKKKFDCFASCVMDAKTLAEAADCEPRCKIEPKKAPEDEPPTQGIPGLWTDPYADASDAGDASG